MKIGYARVSTTNSEQDTSVDAQVELLTAAGCAKVFSERRSAFKRGVKRKEWEKCKDLIRTGHVTHFMICSLSRGSRQSENKEMSLLCAAHGVEFKVLDGTSADVSTPQGRLMVGVMDTVNEVDSLVKGLAVRRGQAARRDAGATAVGKCPFGYRYNGNLPEPDPKRFAAARQLWDRLAETEFRANKVLQAYPQYKFSNSGLIRWMRNPMLAGSPAYAAISVKPLVTPEEFARCQRILDSRSFCHSKAPRKIRLFSRLVRCESCDRFLNYNKGGGKWRLKCMFPKCKHYGRGLAEFKVRQQVIDNLRSNAPRMVELAETRTATPVEISPEHLAATQQLAQLEEMKKGGLANDAMETLIKEVRAKLATPVMEEAAPNWAELAPAIVQPGLIEGFTDAELRPVLLELVEELVYVGNPTAIEIRLR